MESRAKVCDDLLAALPCCRQTCNEDVEHPPTRPKAGLGRSVLDGQNWQSAAIYAGMALS